MLTVVSQVDPRTFRLNYPSGTAIAVLCFLTFVLFVVKFFYTSNYFFLSSASASLIFASDCS